MNNDDKARRGAGGGGGGGEGAEDGNKSVSEKCKGVNSMRLEYANHFDCTQP